MNNTSLKEYDTGVAIASGTIAALIDTRFTESLSSDLDYIRENGNKILDTIKSKLAGNDLVNNIINKTIENLNQNSKQALPDLLYKTITDGLLEKVLKKADKNISENDYDLAGLPDFVDTIFEKLASEVKDKIQTVDNEDSTDSFITKCTELIDDFVDEIKFDLQAELGLLYEPIRTKQYLPVIICECTVSAFYTVSRLIDEIEKQKVTSSDDLESIDIRKILPWKSEELNRMRELSAISFSAVDLSEAAIKAFIKAKGNEKDFVIAFATNVNYFGIGRLAMTLSDELGEKIEQMALELKGVTEKAFDAVRTIGAVIKGNTGVSSMASPVGFITAAEGVYEEIKSSIEEYNYSHEERLRIEAECAKSIEILRGYKENLVALIADYMIDRLSVFGAALDQIDMAIESDDIDSFIDGNKKIQNKLGRESQFDSMDDFDDLMLLDDDLVL